LVSTFADLVADGFEIELMAKVPEGVLPRLRVQIDGVDSRSVHIEDNCLDLRVTPSARVNPWREAEFQSARKDTENSEGERAKPTDPDELRIGATVSAAELPQGKKRFPNARGDKTMARYSRSASGDVKGAMKRRKAGTLKSGRSGKTVKSKKQAIAIGLSEARAKGKKVPSEKSA
jgi:Family of unknown function (DUF6496)